MHGTTSAKRLADPLDDGQPTDAEQRHCHRQHSTPAAPSAARIHAIRRDSAREECAKFGDVRRHDGATPCAGRLLRGVRGAATVSTPSNTSATIHSQRPSEAPSVLICDVALASGSRCHDRSTSSGTVVGSISGHRRGARECASRRGDERRGCERARIDRREEYQVVATVDLALNRDDRRRSRAWRAARHDRLPDAVTSLAARGVGESRRRRSASSRRAAERRRRSSMAREEAWRREDVRATLVPGVDDCDRPTRIERKANAERGGRALRRLDAAALGRTSQYEDARTPTECCVGRP